MTVSPAGPILKEGAVMQLDTEWTQSNLISLCGPLNKRGPVPQRDAVICQASPRESKANMGLEPKSGRQRQPLTSCGLGCMSFSSCFLLLIGLCHHSGKAGRWGKGQHKEVQRLRRRVQAGVRRAAAVLPTSLWERQGTPCFLNLPI